LGNPKEIHFFPKSRVLVIFSVSGTSRTPIQVIEAWGGPEHGGHDPRMTPVRTTAGEYRIGAINAYRTQTWPASQIAWGRLLRDEPKLDDVFFQRTLTNWVSVKSLGISRDQIRREYFRLWGRLEVPKAWVFNDFGPIAIRYYCDRNKNGRRDRDEPFMGEMIHTTPDAEAATARGIPFSLTESHGCVHIRPADRTKLMAAHVFEVGVPFIVHRYSEVAPHAVP
jgi:hypothetical protein